MDKLFNLMYSILGEKAHFHGLTFSIGDGIIIIDYARDVEFELEGGDIDIVDGYVIDYVPYDESISPTSYLALDEEGVKEIISSFITR